MNAVHEIGFQIYTKSTSTNINTVPTSKRLISSICNSLCSKSNDQNLVIVIQYTKDSQPNSRSIKNRFGVKQYPNNFSIEEAEIVKQNIQANLGSDFNLIPCQMDWQKYNQFDAISELVKNECFDLDNQLYLPKSIKTLSSVDLTPLLDYIKTLEGQVMLEVSLESYYEPDERLRWTQAIDRVIENLESKLSQGNAASSFLNSVLEEYKKHQNNYSYDRDLFRYSIRAYAEKSSYVQPLLNLFKNIAVVPEYTKCCETISLTEQEKSLAKSGQIVIQRPEWNNPALVNVSLQTKNKETGWSKFGNNSLNIDRLFESNMSLKQATSLARNTKALPEGDNKIDQSNSAIVSSQDSGKIIKSQSSSPLTIADLKPIHRIVSLEEIQGFLSLAGSIGEFPEQFTIYDVIKQFGGLITENTYVAGIGHNGEPCISDFRKLAHRVVGGMNGTGKTNYIFSVVYQFLYANPDREVFMIDFQAGLHYQFTIGKRKNVKIVTTHQECAELMQEMVHKHSQRREKMIELEVRDLDRLNSKSDAKFSRVLLVIDEAFYIKNCDDREIRKSIEADLNTLAAQARVTGIHLLYSTQTPTSDVLDTQTLNNFGEKVLFAIESAGDSNRIIGTPEAYELPLVPKGRALYKGTDRLPKQIATPLVPDEVWYNMSIK